MDGFLLIDKPAGPTSFDIVRQVKALCPHTKIGHAGTLDPEASGLLIIAIGKATRLLEFLPAEPKRYIFGIRFGAETDTLDSAGRVTRTGGCIPTEEEIRNALPEHVGKRMQQPPRFSALKVNGQRAYSLARQSKEFSLSPREITIHHIAMLGFNPEEGEATCEVSCSRGTYIRSLARDIAAGLGALAYASSIRRTAIGPFSVAAARPFDATDKSMFGGMIPIRTAFADCAVRVSDGQKEALSYGADIGASFGLIDAGQVIAFDEAGGLVAVLQQKEIGSYHPIKVFS